MGLGKLVRDFACGVTLASVLAFGGCAEDTEKVSPYTIKSSNMTIKKSFDQPPSEILLDKESEFLWRASESLMFEAKDESYYYILGNKYNTTINKNPSEKVYSVVSSLKSDYYIMIEDNGKLTKIVAEQGMYLMDYDTIVSPSTGKPVSFEAEYRGLLSGDIIIEAQLSTGETALVQVDLDDNLSNKFALPTTKEIIVDGSNGLDINFFKADYMPKHYDFHSFPAIGQEIEGRNWVVYSLDNPSGVSPLEGVYAYDSLTKSTKALKDIAGDELIDLMGNFLIAKGSGGSVFGIRSVNLDDMKETQLVASEGVLPLTTFFGRRHTWTFRSEMYDTNRYLLYRGGRHPVTGKVQNDIFMINVDVAAFSGNPHPIDTGIDLHNPQVYKVADRFAAGPFVFQQNTLFYILFLDYSHDFVIHELDDARRFRKNVEFSYLGSRVVLSDGNESIIMNDQTYGGSEIREKLDEDFFVARRSLVLKKDFESVAKFTDLSNPRDVEFLDALSKIRSGMEIERSLDGGMGLLIKKISEEERYYLDTVKGGLYRLDGTHSTSHLYDQFEGVLREDPLFIMGSKTTNQKLILSPK
jgi:hypothetical protein